MKLSIAWIFEHINADWKKVDINELVSKFNKTTAEIEAFYKIKTDLSDKYLAKLKDISHETVILYCDELNKEIELPKRDGLLKDKLYLIKKENNNFQWLKSSDLSGQKDFYLPAILVEEKLVKGDWKKNFEVQDYIIEVDNKSVTHRPDLWGHRGYAREIAAILNLPLLPIDKFISKSEIINFDAKSKTTSQNPFLIEIKDSKACKRFATIYINQINNISSPLYMVTRLSRIDSKCINAIVDSTNYVMFDMGQPMHAFDASKLNGNTILPRFAKNGEKLTLLDNETIELTNNDFVIADQKGPIALAGIMGGNNSEVDSNTKSLLIESACFDAATIRKTSIRFKKRTEASARFEKSLDPNQNVLAIQRFVEIINSALKLLNQKIEVNEIISLGKKPETVKINIDQEFIDKRLGVKIDPELIIKTLEKLGFAVTKNENKYHIEVPSFRSSKDIHIKEDIVEEIGRFFGYDNIPFVLPSKQMIPTDTSKLMKIREIKNLLANACQMHEVQNYPFFDESFLNEIKWEPANAISVISPVSENWKRLVTSLIPHLFKNIQQNFGKERIDFFELNRIWKFENNKPIEKKVLAGIFFDNQNQINFYNEKAKLELLFNALKINVNWQKQNKNNIFVDVWYSKYQSAQLICEGQVIGIAGIISNEYLEKIASGNAFAFEIDADFIINLMPKLIKFKSLSKFQPGWLDISIFINIDKNVNQVIQVIKKSDTRIFKVELLDIFEKPEWNDKKSLTFRYTFVDENKTLVKDEISEIENKVKNEVKKLGAELR